MNSFPLGKTKTKFLRTCCRLKRWTGWELFYLGQNENCSLGDCSTSASSEELYQRGSGARSTYKMLVKGEFSAIKHLTKGFLLVKRSWDYHKGISYFSRYEEIQGLGSWNQFLKTMADFIFLSSRITADSDCSHKIKRPLLLGRKAMTNLDSILESRDLSLTTKVHIVKAMVFPVVMYGCMDVRVRPSRKLMLFKLWCRRRLLRVPWTARRSNQSILKDINPDIHWKDWCWSWSSNILATWYEGPVHWKRPWCWERLRAGGEGGDRGWDGWMASQT